MSSEDNRLSGPGLSARATAYHRALEGERPDALFRDPLARLLAGPNPERLGEIPAFGARNAWSTAVRTVVFDEILLGLLEREDPDLVLSLGAGLDTRPYRLELPSSLRWVEVDLPEVVEYKRRRLKGEPLPRRVERVPLDLTKASERRGLLARLSSESRHALVLAEGLLIYLSEFEVARLARSLHLHPAFRWWVTEVAAPPVLTTARRRGLHGTAHPELRFRFAPEEGVEFFRPLGWLCRGRRPFLDEALRLERIPGPPWIHRLALRLVPGLGARYRALASIVLLERDGSSDHGEGA